MSSTEKIKLIASRNDITLSELAQRLGYTQGNLSQKLRLGNFRESELIRIANALGVKYEGFFILSDGETF
jgi:transcriptional regulator with XRE-family HTH domain